MKRVTGSTVGLREKMMVRVFWGGGGGRRRGECRLSRGMRHTHQRDLRQTVDAKPEAEEVLEAAGQRACVPRPRLLLPQVAQLEK